MWLHNAHCEAHLHEGKINNTKESVPHGFDGSVANRVVGRYKAIALPNVVGMLIIRKHAIILGVIHGN